jgi:divinyl protochlorophyllide a 8-vinyl-reductase
MTGAATHAHSVAGAARIGPNAIIRTAEALRERLGDGRTAALFREAGLGAYLTAMPDDMVDEREVIALHRILRTELGTGDARAIARDAGRRTGDYLLAHRIPHLAQRVLRALPAPLATRALLAAVARHAWTFAGSGRFQVRAGRPTRVMITGCPLCRHATATAPVCDFYAGTFERLFRRLVSPQTSVIETECEAAGSEACIFEIRLD